MASKVTTSRAGHRPRAVSWIGWSDRSIEDLLLDAGVHLDRVVDADAEQDGQAGDGDDRQRDAEVAGQAEGPDDADEDHGQRQQAPPDVEEDQQDQDHDRHGDGAQREHPAPQVVVDVPQQDGGAGGHGLGVRRTRTWPPRPGRAGRPRPRPRCPRCRGRRTMTWACGRVGEERPQRQADLVLVVVEQEVDPVGVVERAPRARARPRAGPASPARRRSGPRTPASPGSSALSARRSAAPAMLWVGSPLSLATRASSNSSAVSGVMTPWTWPDASSVSAKSVELGDALLGEQLVDRVALVHRDDGQHGLAAEQVLVRDVVLVDLIGLVEVAVLAGRELELGDAVAEGQRQDEADQRRRRRLACPARRRVATRTAACVHPPGRRRGNPVGAAALRRQTLRCGVRAGSPVAHRAVSLTRQPR